MFRLWDQYLTLFAEAWHSWHSYWLKIAEQGEIPVYFFRFEDMLADRKKEMTKIMSFLLGIETSKDTVLEARITEMCAFDEKKNQIYKPGTGSANEKMFNYTAK